MTAQELKNHFSFSYKDFSDPLAWSRGIGITFTKEYQNGYASLYKFGINEEEFDKENPFKNLRITVIYGEKTPEGVKLSDKNSLKDPIDLSSDEYFYNTETNRFYHNRKEITPKDILIEIEGLHTKPGKTYKGFLLRFRLRFWRKILPLVIKYIDVILIKLLWIISGEKVKDSVWKRIFGIYSEKKDEKIPAPDIFDSSNTMDFFGYKAKRWSVVFYSALHLVFFILYFLTKVEYEILSKIFMNNFLMLCYTIFSFAITEAGIPTLLKWIINTITPRAFNSASFKPLKI